MKTRFVTLALSLVLILAVARADAQTVTTDASEYLRGDVNADKALDVELNVVVEVDGIAATSSIPLSRFQPHERQTVQVELAADATLDLLNMRYAGHVHVSYSTLDADGNPAGQGESEHLNFHPSTTGEPGSSFLVYGTGPLLE